MGVKGLLTLVNDNQSVLLSDLKLHDTKLIIDGSNLLHYLYSQYKVPSEYGGDYNHYARVCKTFFNTLKKCNVDPYVLLDGGYDPDDRKLQTVLRRKAQRRERSGAFCKDGPSVDGGEAVLPILAEETFRHVLYELQIPHVVCTYEADREIAVLSKKWKCPVLSNDTDFCIYCMDGGFIPMKYKDTDFIDMKLRLYNRETGVSSMCHAGTIPSDESFVYISVKYYHFERFVDRANGTPDFLPIFATLCGNDFVDKEDLKSFYTAICKDYKEKPLNIKAKTRILCLLHWSMAVNNEQDAVKYVLSHVQDKPPGRKSALMLAISSSIDDYRNIQSFTSLDIDAFFETSTCTSSIREEEIQRHNLAKLTDYVTKEPLPQWCSANLRSYKMPECFLQTVAVNHKVIFSCQIENLEEPSTYACCRHIRSIIYGITTTFSGKKTKAGKSSANVIVDPKGSRKNCIEESDRKKADREKVYVKPTLEVSFRSQTFRLPTLVTVPDKTEDERRQILYVSLGVTPGLVDDPCVAFLIGVLRVWFIGADPKVTSDYVYAVVICVITLHINEFQTRKEKRRSDITVEQPVMIQSIIDVLEAQPDDSVKNILKKMATHLKTPDQSAWGTTETEVIHGFSQFQACYLNAMFLNQALMFPVNLPSPGVMFNCTFMYNVYKMVRKQEIEGQYIADIFTEGSLLHKLIISWMDYVKGTCSEGCGESTASGHKATDKKGKKKSKTLYERKK